jgi:hypothetical protein
VSRAESTSAGTRSWQRKMDSAQRITRQYGRRARVFGMRGPHGWYYLAVFASAERQNIR